MKKKATDDGRQQILTLGKETIRNPIEQVEAFKKYFASVYAPQPANINIAEILEEPILEVLDELDIKTISEPEVLAALKKLKPKRSMGVDRLPQYFFKYYAEPLLKPLHYIFNLAMAQQKFPDRWKKAIVIPIPKKSQTKEISEHRPISMLCSPGKALESILHGKILQHLNPIITEHQYGFIPGKSTVSNLVNFFQKGIQAFENKTQLDVIYTDFKKAFDLVDFAVLLKKLRKYGFSANLINFFYSYLWGREQQVLYNSSMSSLFPVYSSVPQGSNLGPLLFLVIINDLPNIIKSSNVYLFADDLKISKEIKDETDCQNLQKDIDSVTEWAKINKMQFNLDKCTVMTFSLKKNIIRTEYKMGKVNLKVENVTKDLGVWFDTKFTFEKHISTVVNEAFRMLGFLKRNCQDFRNEKTVITLYNSFVRSKLEYASIIWNPYHDNRIKQVEKVQKKFSKYLNYKFKNARHNTNVKLNYDQLRQIYQLDTLNKRREIGCLLYLYKVINNKEKTKNY